MLTQAEYEAKREARYLRLLEAARKAEAEGNGLRNTAHAMADVIPFGQPILVGHYSEGRDRNYRAKIENKFRRGYELLKKSEELKSRAESAAENTAIYAEDPQAVQKIDDKLESLLKLQARYKAINDAHKKYLKNPASLETCDLSESDKATVRNYVPQYSWEPHPVAPFQFTNLSANIRRLKERAQIVERKQAMEDSQETLPDGTRIEYIPSENRIRIYFTARCPREQYEKLRQHGFRVAPSFGDYVFSAYYNNNAKYCIEQFVKSQ